MPRLLIKQAGVLRRVASINVADEGSIRLSLVRAGMSESGWSWSEGEGSKEPVAEKGPETKTKEITIHTSGRINYHFGAKQRRFIPCLLDLEEQIPIVLYVVPSLTALDRMTVAGEGDHIVEVPDVFEDNFSFNFSVVPLLAPPLNGEVMRLGVEGLYGLACACGAGNSGFARPEVPPEAFTTIVPSLTLAEQAVPEEVAFLRFKRSMYANDVQAALRNARAPIPVHEVEALIQSGPGLYPPNKEGVWTLIAAVPMRIAPRLEVDFADKRYRADVVELRPGDLRLATVRVRFKVFDDMKKVYVKTLVDIRSVALHAEL